MDDADFGVFGRLPRDANLKKPLRELLGSEGSGDAIELVDTARVFRLAAKLGE